MNQSTPQQLKIGKFLPAFEYMMDGQYGTLAEPPRGGQRAEDLRLRLGMDTWVPLIFHYDQPDAWTGHRDGGAWKACPHLAALAAATTRIELALFLSCTSSIILLLLAEDG